jgi:Cu/Ag efflux protein CusF
VSEIQVGQGIRFALEQEHAGEYVLAQVFSSLNGGDTMSEVTPEQMRDDEAQAEFTRPEQPHRIMAAAVVRGVLSDEHKLRLEHEPIEKLGWPSMTMNFRVLDSVPIDHLQAGQDIHFAMVRQDDSWVIDQIHLLDAATAPVDHDREHDHD